MMYCQIKCNKKENGVKIKYFLKDRVFSVL